MKIISHFKDYYDGLSSHDADSGVYERKTASIPVEWFGYNHSVIQHDRSYELQTGLIGFCGKLYPFVKYSNLPLGNVSTCDMKSIKFLYTYKDFKTAREEFKTLKGARYYWDGGYDSFKSFSGLDNAKLWFDQDFQTLIDDLPKWKTSRTGKMFKSVIPKELFYEHKVPCFALIYRDDSSDRSLPPYRLILNPKLSDYKFYQLFDVYSAFQEIEQFVSNDLIRPDDPYIQPISDVLKAESHGFNAESFRTPKSKHKKGENK